MKFPVLAAGVHAGGQLFQEFMIDFTAKPFFPKLGGIGATDDGFELLADEIADELRRVQFPQGEASVHPYFSQVVFAVFSQVLEEDIAENDVGYALFFEL